MALQWHCIGMAVGELRCMLKSQLCVYQHVCVSALLTWYSAYIFKQLQCSTFNHIIWFVCRKVLRYEFKFDFLGMQRKYRYKTT